MIDLNATRRKAHCIQVSDVRENNTYMAKSSTYVHYSGDEILHPTIIICLVSAMLQYSWHYCPLQFKIFFEFVLVIAESFN